MTSNYIEHYKIQSNPHIVSILESQIALLFTLRSAVFKLQDVLIKVEQMTIMTLNTVRSKVLRMCSSGIPESECYALSHYKEQFPKYFEAFVFSFF